MEISATQLQQKSPHLHHTTYYKNFFVMRTIIVVNGQQAQVGVDNEGWLTLSCRNPKVGVTFDSLVTDVNEVLQQHGLHGVSNYWCEEVPLFELKGTSQKELEKLLNLEGEIREQLALKINTRMKALLQHSATSSPSLHVLVQPQLYLLIPDYTHMDAKPIQIKKANFAECMALFSESRLFDFGAVFRASRDNPSRKDTGPESFHHLVEELHAVVGWYSLGLSLKIPEYQLQIIRQNHPRDTDMCRTKMLSWWWDNSEERKWATLAQALAKTGSRVLASKMALTYGVPVPCRVQEWSSVSVEDHSSGLVDLLGALVRKLRNDIDDQDQDLAQREQSFQQAEQEKRAISQQLKALEYKLAQSESRIAQLIKERGDAASALKLQEFEFQVMRQAANQQIELQQQSIFHKEKEIAHLKMRLQVVEKELDETKPQIPALKEELRKASQELEKKSAEIQLLQETKSCMKLLLDTERKVLDNYLLQQTAASISHDRYKQELEMQLHFRKEMSVKEMEAFQEYLEERDPEIKKIVQCISAQNAQLPEKAIMDSTEVFPIHRRKARVPIPTDSLSQKHKTDVGGVSYMLNFLQWEQGKVAPQAMARGSAAVYGHTVFTVGENSNQIHCYCLQTDEWSILSTPCPHTNPGLVFVDSVLTAVGGEVKSRSTNKVTCWKREKWTKEIPPMQHPHSSPSALNTGSYLIVAGAAWNNEKSVIELFSHKTRSWCKVFPLPMPFYGITTTLCNDDYVVMDGTGTTYSINLPTLLIATSTYQPYLWKNLPHVPSVLGEVTLTTFHKHIICVCSYGIYQLNEEVWVRIQDSFSFSSWSKSIVCVVGKKLVVMGGYNPYNDSATTEVNVAEFIERL